MKKRTFKNKLISIIAAASMLIGTIPVFASSSYTISINDPKNYSAGNNFSAEGSSYLVAKTYLSNNPSENIPWIEYEIYVEKAGEYDIEFKSSFLDGKYTSKEDVTIDGTKINTLLSLSQGTSDIEGIYKGHVYLTNGSHKLRFTMSGAVTEGKNAGMGYFHLFYITLTKRSEELKYNAPDDPQGWQYTEGNEFIHTFSADKVWKKSFMAQAGTYELTWRTTDIAGSQYVSPAVLTVNGTPVTATSKTSAASSTYIQKANVNLIDGINSIVFKVDGKKGNEDGYLMYIAYVQAEKVDATKSLKFDNNAGSTNGNVYYGGTAHQMFVNGTETFNLNVPAGEYNLYAAASCSVFTSYLGTLGFAVGSADMTDFTSTNVTQGTKYNDIGGDFKYNGTLNLTGNETITFKTTATAVSVSSNNYTLFDYFELVPVNPVFGNAEINVADTLLATGASTTATSNLYYESGYIASDRLIDAVAYSSSDNSVVLVNNNGEILAKNPGVATVTVTYTVGEETYTASENITVYGEDNIIPISVSYDAETKKATVKLSTLSDEAKSAAVILGGYELGADGKVSKFTDIFSANKEIARGRVSTIEHVIEGDNIRAFIWNSLDGMKPIRDDIKVK